MLNFSVLLKDFACGHAFLGKRYEAFLVCRVLHPGKFRATVEKDLTFNTAGNIPKTKETHVLKTEKACCRRGASSSSLEEM